MQSSLAKLPSWAANPLRELKIYVKAIPYRGSGRYCPVCGNSSSRFRPTGLVPRDDAQCAHCGSLERHRLLWLYLTNESDLFDRHPRRMLHVAPERCLEKRFKDLLGEDYLTADLYNPRAMVRMDITQIEYPERTFDVIYCSHVLEHVPDDRQAMREFYRVLKDDGWAILLVPITADQTIEDPKLEDPVERLRRFGQADHVRRYGPDYVERLQEAGFRVETITVDDLVADPKAAVQMGLTAECGAIYFCTK